jgi:hypothetical protein
LLEVVNSTGYYSRISSTVAPDRPRYFTYAQKVLKNLGNGIRQWIKWVDESLTQSKETSMLWTIILILVVLWLLGLIGHIGGGLIHLLLVIAVIVLVIQLIQGRRL